MKFRVLDLSTGKKVKINKKEQTFVMTTNGEVQVVDYNTNYLCSVTEILSKNSEGYVVQYAFSRKENGKWRYCQEVVFPNS